MRVGRADDLDTRFERAANVHAAEVEAVWESVHLERHVLLNSHLEDSLQLEGVLGSAVDVAALGMAQAAHVGVAKRRLHPVGHLPLGHPLPAMDAGLHPI